MESEIKHPVTVVSFLPQYIQDQYSHVIMLAVVVVLAILASLLTKSMLREVPTKKQAFFEWLIGSLYGLGESVMGKEGLKYMPFVLGIGFYVCVSNLLGIIPGFTPPTMNLNTTVAAAVSTFFVYNYIGFKKHGVGYLKQLLGPMLVIAPLMLLIELIGHLARPLSLSMRLFGNISGEEIIVLIIFSMVPFIIPLPMYLLLTFSGCLQAFVFMLLTMVYIGGALEDAH